MMDYLCEFEARKTCFHRTRPQTVGKGRHLSGKIPRKGTSPRVVPDYPRGEGGLILATHLAQDAQIPAQVPSAEAADGEFVTVMTGNATTARRLTRAEVATLMGVSPSTVVRRERAGLLRAEVVDGVHVFDETEVKQTITTQRHRTAISALGGTTGDVAALVLTELDAGATPVEIVKRHAFAPAAVKALIAQYRDFRDEVAISSGELATLRTQAAERLLSVKSARPATCMGCDREPRVRACAACLASDRAHVDRHRRDGVEHVRFALRDGDGGTTYVSDWTPLLDSEIRSKPSG
jgi:hypothetical protein